MNLSKNTAIALVIIVVVALAAIAYFVFVRGMNDAGTTDYNSLTPEQKQDVLDSLTAPESQLEKMEERKALQSLSTTTRESKLSSEERKSALDSLQAP